jgi:hypothetical protein
MQYREFNRLSDDSCYRELKDFGNEKKLKYMTTRVEDSQLVTEGKVNFLGLPSPLTASDFKPEVDTDMKFAQLTNCGDRTALGPLPLNGPLSGLSGPDVLLTGSHTRERGACTPVVTDYQERTFTPFINVEVPDPMKSVYDGYQAGLSTRSQNRIKQVAPRSQGTFNVSPVECKRVRKFTNCD